VLSRARRGDAVPLPDTPLASGLRIRGLTKSYGPVRAVAGVDLDIVPGQTVALLGPNGAGRSTTIDMLLGLTRPDAGSVAVFGRTPEQAVRDGLVGAMLRTGGRVVADGPATAIKAVVGGRTVRATLPGASASALGDLPGVRRRRAPDLAAVRTGRDPDHLRPPRLPAPGDGRRRARLRGQGRPGRGARRRRPAGRGRSGRRRPRAGRRHPGGGASPLSGRERDVLVAARDAATVATTVGRLVLSEGTVRNYLSAAITKTSTRNRAEALRTAEDNGWL